MIFITSLILKTTWQDGFFGGIVLHAWLCVVSSFALILSINFSFIVTLLNVSYCWSSNKKNTKQQHDSEKYGANPMQETCTVTLPEAALWENAIHCLLFCHYHHFGGYFVEDLKHRTLAYVNI